MRRGLWWRKFIGGVWNAVIKGTYHEDSKRPISEDCFGDWMHDEFMNKIHAPWHKLKDDFWSFGIDDAYVVGKTLVDMHYKNMEAC